MPHNILLFTSTFPRSSQDAQTPRFVLDLGRELSRFYNVFVLTPHASGSAREETLDGLHVIRYRYFLPETQQSLAYGAGITINLRSNPLAWLQVPTFLYCQWRALEDTVRRYNIHLVNSHWMAPQGLTAALHRRSLGFPHVLTIHSAGLHLLRRIAMGRRLGRFLVRRCDAIYSVSKHNQLLLNDLIGREVSSKFLPMGIDTEYYFRGKPLQEARLSLGLPEAEQIILFIGRLSIRKGVLYLLRALTILSHSGHSPRLVIVGTGPEESALREETRRLNLEDRVVFAGPKNREEVRDYLEACDLVAIPSIRDPNGEVEGFPVVLLEALASGKPVVGTDTGGTPEGIIEGETGFVVPPENPEALAEAFCKILDRGPETFSEPALASVRKFDWKAIGEDYQQTFDRLINTDSR